MRTLKPGERIPDGEPWRGIASHGYVILAWWINGEQVRTYEHRVVDGHITTAEHVHHKNHDRADNRPENLEYLTEAEHAARHRENERRIRAKVRAFYQTALWVRPHDPPPLQLIADMFSLDASVVSRHLTSGGFSPADHRPAPWRAIPDDHVATARHLSRSAREMAHLLNLTVYQCRELMKERQDLPRFTAGRPRKEAA